MNIDTIATLADKLPREQTKKAAIFALTNELARGHELTEHDIAMLYAYFTPNTPAKPKTDIQWLALALPKNDVRYYLNYIYSDGARIMATDGHRLHVVTNSEYDAGYYDKNMNKAECNGKFPDIDKLIGDYPKSMSISNMSIIDIGESRSFAQAYDHKDIRLDKKYIDQAAQYLNADSFKYKNGLSNVLIQSGNKMAVVMPMRK
jgi:hypothetical protein